MPRYQRLLLSFNNPPTIDSDLSPNKTVIVSVGRNQLLGFIHFVHICGKGNTMHLESKQNVDEWGWTVGPTSNMSFCETPQADLAEGNCKTWTLDSGLDRGLDYGLDWTGLDWTGLDWSIVCLRVWRPLLIFKWCMRRSAPIHLVFCFWSSLADLHFSSFKSLIWNLAQVFLIRNGGVYHHF